MSRNTSIHTKLSESMVKSHPFWEHIPSHPFGHFWVVDFPNFPEMVGDVSSFPVG